MNFYTSDRACLRIALVHLIFSVHDDDQIDLYLSVNVCSLLKKMCAFAST